MRETLQLKPDLPCQRYRLDIHVEPDFRYPYTSRTTRTYLAADRGLVARLRSCFLGQPAPRRAVDTDAYEQVVYPFKFSVTIIPDNRYEAIVEPDGPLLVASIDNLSLSMPDTCTQRIVEHKKFGLVISDNDPEHPLMRCVVRKHDAGDRRVEKVVYEFDRWEAIDRLRSHLIAFFSADSAEVIQNWLNGQEGWNRLIDSHLLKRAVDD
jgi:hypothetical protein